jgi:cardiolipin synthase
MLKKNIPNILSALRILSVPIFLYFYFSNTKNHLIVACTVFVIAGLTDVIDGFIARRFNLITSLGKILDPLADKLVQTGVLVALTISRILPIPIVAIFVAKELFTLIGSLLIYKKRAFITVSNVFGKLSTLSFYFSMAIIMLLSFFEVDKTVFAFTVSV